MPPEEVGEDDDVSPLNKICARLSEEAEKAKPSFVGVGEENVTAENTAENTAERPSRSVTRADFVQDRAIRVVDANSTPFTANTTFADGIGIATLAFTSSPEAEVFDGRTLRATTPRGTQRSPGGTERTPRETQRTPRGTQRTPRGTERIPRATSAPASPPRRTTGAPAREVMPKLYWLRSVLARYP